MFEPPKSLTAIVHLRFQEPTGKPPNEEEMEILSRLIGQAYELDPELKEILVRFADYLNKASSGRKGWWGMGRALRESGGRAILLSQCFRTLPIPDCKG